MGLHGVLTAMRHILLDFDSIPATEPERLSLYSAQFTDLTAEEIEDLAKISADRFEIYKATIFTGEASTLRNHFRMTFGLCSKVWKELYGRKLHVATLVRNMHSVRPWKTTTTDGLAQNLVSYLSEDLPELRERAPEILSSVLFEYTNIGIKRYPDPEIGPRQSLSQIDFASYTVEQLLALPCIIMPGLQCLSFKHDILQLFHHFYESGGELLPVVATRTVLGVGARNTDQRAEWFEAGPALFAFFKEAVPGERLLVQAFAEASLPDAGDTESEEDLFAYFIQQLLSAVSAGALVVLRE